MPDSSVRHIAQGPPRGGAPTGFLEIYQQNGSQVFEGQHQGREAWERDNQDPNPRTPPNGQFPMHNGGHVKFEVPKVPVIFVLDFERLLNTFQNKKGHLEFPEEGQHPRLLTVGCSVFYPTVLRQVFPQRSANDKITAKLSPRWSGPWSVSVRPKKQTDPTETRRAHVSHL
uniref:Uncharacterized protein n=1 Tax=Timema cristinae TaxID=61476 RepID=A0A7R9DJ44_TIMCR|nr:unnamed protein product [Timema cristinae]